MRNIISDDFPLLEMMVKDSIDKAPIYKPGRYWAAKTKNAVNEIKKYGISDFRGSSNLIGLSYADNFEIDIRNRYRLGTKRFVGSVTRMYPINKLFDAQVRNSLALAREGVSYAQEIIKLKEKERGLLKRYKIPYSLLGGCKSFVHVDGKDISIHYLNLLEQHDCLTAHIQFSGAKTVFEIGGGYGVNVHLLLENYKNIRKVLYLDIPPNLYVGTQYLKSFYGDSVHDYRLLRNQTHLKFSANSDLEILCIAPWQIEGFDGTVDVFMNRESFVEMPIEIVRNYVNNLMRFPQSSSTAIALTSYDGFLSSTFNPSLLPDFFKGRAFEHFETPTLLDSTHRNIHYVSSGKFSSSKT